MPRKAVVTVRLTPQLRDRLKKIAGAMDRPRSWVISRALEQFVATQSWQIDDIRRDLAEADAGDFASEAQVKAVFAKWRRRGNAR